MIPWQDIRYCIRSLRRNPAVVAACVLILALGIGANTAIFSAVKAILLEPLPYPDPSRLVALYEAGVIQGDVHDEPAPGNFYDWQRQARSFEQIAAYGGMNGNLSGSAGRLPEHIQGVFCSWNLFRTLRIPAALGRVFLPADDNAAAPRTIILSDGLWRHRFGGDPAIIGRTLRLDEQLYTVIGVMPRSFEFPDAATAFWIPMQKALPSAELQTRGDHRLSVIARLQPGISIQQSAAELSGIQAHIARDYSGQTGTSVDAYPLEGEVVDRALRTSLYVLWEQSPACFSSLPSMSPIFC